VSKSIGNALPDSLRTALSGDDLDRGAGLTYILLTPDELGDVSIALLSVGEVLATDERTIRLALWPGTTATANLERTGRGTLASIEPEATLYVRFDAERVGDVRAGGMNHASFVCRVTDVLADDVSYATITAGLRFALRDPDAVLPRWRETIEALREAARAG
jgi:hypothetical protein